MNTFFSRRNYNTMRRIFLNQHLIIASPLFVTRYGHLMSNFGRARPFYVMFGRARSFNVIFGLAWHGFFCISILIRYRSFSLNFRLSRVFSCQLLVMNGLVVAVFYFKFWLSTVFSRHLLVDHRFFTSIFCQAWSFHKSRSKPALRLDILILLFFKSNFP